MCRRIHLMRQTGVHRACGACGRTVHLGNMRPIVESGKSCPMLCGSRARLNHSHLMRVGEGASSGRFVPAPAHAGHVGELPAEGLRPRPRLLRTPPEQLAEPRAHGGPDRYVGVQDPSTGVRVLGHRRWAFPSLVHVVTPDPSPSGKRVRDRDRWSGEMESEPRSPAAQLLRA